MLSLIELLYGPEICLVTLLRDVDITLRDVDITLLYGIGQMISGNSGAITDIGIRRALEIFDKLAMSHIVNTIISSNIVPDVPIQTLIINHCVTACDDIVSAYADGYRIVYNNIVHEPLSSTGATITRALKNNIYVKKMCNNEMNDRTICLCQSLDELLADNTRIIPKFTAVTVVENRTLSAKRRIYKKTYNDEDIRQLSDVRITISANLRLAPSCRKLTTIGPCISDNEIYPCIMLEKLDAQNNYAITTCEPFATSLKKLNASGNCGITDDGLRLCNNITDLNADRNGKITTCAPFAQTLITLSIQATSGICDKGLIACTHIERLNIIRNSRITTCAPFAKTLIKLSAYDANNLTYDGICDCTAIRELLLGSNSGIAALPLLSTQSLNKLSIIDTVQYTNLDQCYNLHELCVTSNQCSVLTDLPSPEKCHTLGICAQSSSSATTISDTHLVPFVNIKELSANDLPSITSCKPFATSLRTLRASGNMCGINDHGLSSCTNIITLFASRNPCITSCKPFAISLRTLHANGYVCGISNESILLCVNIHTLSANDNPKISTCKPFAHSLRVLFACYWECGIDDAGLAACKHIEEIHTEGNLKITMDHVAKATVQKKYAMRGDTITCN